MSQEPVTTHALTYDGNTSELYKIYLLSILLSIVTLGIYHFWGKTRKRRYVTSSFMLDKDRFEYTGYGLELFLGLIFGLIMLAIISLPLYWASEEVETYQEKMKHSQTNPKFDFQPNKDIKKTHFRVEEQDPFENKFVFEFNSISDFWIRFNNQGFLISYADKELDIKWRFMTSLFGGGGDVQFIPEQNYKLLFAILLTPIYMIFYFIYLPFVIVYGSLRYRLSRLRWRGIRGHLDGSSLLYGLIGLGQTLMKFLTLGFWIPISDVIMYKYKMKKLHFGNQLASFTPCIKMLIIANLASIGASLYLLALMAACGYWLLPFIAHYVNVPAEGWIAKPYITKLLKEGYLISILLLLWGCYAPRYWYRAAFLREKYNQLHFGSIGFACNATGMDYLRLFVINDLIFIFTFGFGLPFIWQRRMRFICKHVSVIGNLAGLDIEQAPGEKSKFGGGFASVMNLEIGLI